MASTVPIDYPLSVYQDRSSARGNSSDLPAGRCNYADLTTSGPAARCGCRRFWGRTPQRGYPDAGADALLWCMCGHHACYHDNGGQTTQPTQQLQQQPTQHSHQFKRPQPPTITLPRPAAAKGQCQENEKPRTYREPLNPAQVALTPRLTNTMPSVADVASVASFTTSRFDDFEAQLAQFGDTRPEPSLPETLCWDDAGGQDMTEATQLATQVATQVATQPATVPPPSQYRPPSRASSVASVSQARYLRPFSGKGLRTLGGPHGSLRSILPNIPDHQESTQEPTQEPTQELIQDSDSRNFRYRYRSPAAVMVSFEAAQKLHRAHRAQTRSSSKVPVEIKSAAEETAAAPTTALVVGTGKDSNGGNSPASELAPTLLPQSYEQLGSLATMVQAHDDRLATLENMSFINGNHDDCLDRYDQLDLRSADMEMRMSEVERYVDNAQASLIDNPALSVVSVSSIGTTRPARPGSTTDLHDQIQALQSRVTQLQSYLPSPQFSWDVEVVFMPFPLKRLWQKKDDFTMESDDDDEWTQVPNMSSALPLRAQSPYSGGWSVKQDDYEWLLPRACRADSLQNHRLRSRGLVRTISIKGPDARSVHAAMDAAFGATLAKMGMTGRKQPPRYQSSAPDARIDRFLGLQQPWVPLRKVYKESRLRFLTPAEMITPSLWDVGFLNSVVMRATNLRLFVTNPEAYLQGRPRYKSYWSWKRVREMTQVHTEWPGSQDVPEVDADEVYWQFDEQLDEPPNPHSSTKRMHPRSRQMSAPPAPQAYAAAAATLSGRWSASPAVTRPLGSLSASVPVSVPMPVPVRKRTRGAAPTTKDCPPPPPLMDRTNYMTSTEPSPSPSSHLKRRISATADHQPRPTIRSSSSMDNKRRRTNPPESYWCTPRMTESLSPAPEGPPYERRSVPRCASVPYATPSSNPPPRLDGRAGLFGGDNDDDAKIYFDEECDGQNSSMPISQSAEDSDMCDDDENQSDSDNGETVRDFSRHASTARQGLQSSDDWSGIVSPARQEAQLPENVARQGIEDKSENDMSEDDESEDDEPEDDESEDDGSEDDKSEVDGYNNARNNHSNHSSQPSEYPSTQRLWTATLIKHESTQSSLQEDEDGVE
jgi:hypothetical protein